MGLDENCIYTCGGMCVLYAWQIRIRVGLRLTCSEQPHPFLMLSGVRPSCFAASSSIVFQANRQVYICFQEERGHCDCISSLTMAFAGPSVTKALSAASKGDLNTLKRLKEQLNLSECADKFGATPVHYSARAGKVDCVRWLVQAAGVSGNKPANNGATPAHDAGATGQLDCLQWLIQNGGCSASSKDACGATPLHLGE